MNIIKITHMAAVLCPITDNYHLIKQCEKCDSYRGFISKPLAIKCKEGEGKKGG